ncbi:MAG: O-acetylhomoserine aminocarboxypropyltransferase/cysteine synthase [Betaproteobacteria bacterium]|uniref:O-acetylhomoserine/O-acetylserine sulfhydrylase n=1 Tax=Methylophilales bacterium HTCC2181 TaxID=383631 RepID=A0P6U9_9PROT|nr:O-acetylhomoserine/O-acetylserine sulfhydrylase [Methylophilales bacterium HTCC2181]MCH9781976.1 O-acetylhomoserine aminocarboxypropyltransferase/cysteine synthase [Betaproteobacteria bacterium]MDA9819199.1 O-acetylhomoserine aminocarboxypropyltransferase/cysteine synthase [Methylophilaceae bacterium]MCH9842004.1 O-acetylhomoserine aminocarboxypropyltransferase/cysteine synthase [Betaproteobacteria bacterium]MDC0552697.1 O-acetylhomoserine aminocarboxypropyltransferase/cysteine synthase [Met
MKLETIALHHGYDSDKNDQKAATTPIYQSSGFTIDDTQHGADLFDLKVEGNIYSRIGNPTNDVLERRVAEMEGGIGALSLASGMAAITYAIQCIARAGDNIVSTNQLYGGTYNSFMHSFPKQGITVKMVDGADFKGLDEAIDEHTKAVYCESIGNPLGNIIDLKKFAEIAHKHGIPLIVDNTVATPYLCRPIDFGADIVIHSLTKYIDGHGATIGGIIVDSGKFDWVKEAKKFPMLNEPDPSYHGVIYTEHFGPAAFIACCRVVPLRESGACLSPHSAFLIMLGLESLGVRMERHCQNALALATYLKNHERVEWVNYAALPDDKYHDVCKKITKGQASGIISFGIKGGTEAAAKFIDALQIILRVLSMGDAKSLACHPASTLHRQLTPEQKVLAGVSEDLIRISVGIEHIDDIIEDVEQAIEASKK